VLGRLWEARFQAPSVHCNDVRAPRTSMASEFEPKGAERVVMTSAEYEYVRADPTRFVVAKGHVLPEVESVVDRAKDHVVVEEEGEAAYIAIRLDQSTP
jgi:hypothetical protein